MSELEFHDPEAERRRLLYEQTLNASWWQRAVSAVCWFTPELGVTGTIVVTALACAWPWLAATAGMLGLLVIAVEVLYRSARNHAVRRHSADATDRPDEEAGRNTSPDAEPGEPADPGRPS